MIPVTERGKLMAQINELETLGAATLRDVAERAGVARMTASRAISGKGYVSDKTRAAVMQAVEELSYRPNMSARSMKQQRSHLVGVLVQNNPKLRFTHPLAWEFILGINEGLEQSGYMTTLIRFDDIAEDGGFSAKAFEGHLLDGLIAVNLFPPALEGIIEAAAPRCVWLDANAWSEHNCIRRDEAWAGELAVRELAKLGYREIVAVRNEVARQHQHYSYDERWRGAQKAARECGVTLRQWLKPAWPNDSFTDLIGQLRREDAVLMMDNYSAHALVLPLARAGVRPGIDIALACCDDDFQDSAYHYDAISRVAFDRFEMGYDAALMMLQLTQNSDARCTSRRVRHAWIAGETAIPAI